MLSKRYQVDGSSILPKPSYNDPLKHLKTRIDYLNRVKQLIDGNRAREALIDARRRNIEQQNMKNYQMECDKIILALEHSASPGLSRKQLINRRDEVRKLGIKSVSGGIA
jgi:hypothetical protein